MIRGASSLSSSDCCAQRRVRSVEVTGIQAVHRHGQTFVTWKDVAEGEAGAKFRYSLYRSEQPITADNLAQAELCYRGVLNNSAKLFGSAFNMKDRLDPAKPTASSRKGASRCRPGAGWRCIRCGSRQGLLRRRRHRREAQAGQRGRPGQERHDRAGRGEAGADPADQALRLEGAQGPYVASTSITGKKGLPLHLTLHGSQGQGGGAGEYGDYYLFFGTPDMGYRDGLPGVFSVEEHRRKEGNRLLLRVRDAVEHPSGRGPWRRTGSATSACRRGPSTPSRASIRSPRTSCSG